MAGRHLRHCVNMNKKQKRNHKEGGLLKGENYGFAVLCNEGEMDVTEMLWILYNAVLGYG